MQIILTVFNNRELALIIWILIALACLLISKSIRPSFLAVMKAFLARKIVTVILLMLAYISLVVYVAYSFHLWDFSLLKDTIVWCLGTAFVMFYNYDKVNTEKKYFKNVLLDNLKLAVFLQFIINLYVFNIVVELILVPVLVFVGALLAVSETKKEYKPVKNILQFLLAIYGVYLLVFAIVHMVSDFKDFATLYNLKDFLLAPFLTMTFLPFLYFLALYTTYEALFIQLDIFSRDQSKALRRFTKRQIIRTCLFNLRKLNRFSKDYAIEVRRAENKEEVIRLTHRFKVSARP